MIPAVSEITENRHTYAHRRERILLTVAGVFLAASVWALAVGPQAPDSNKTGLVADPVLLLCLALWFGAALSGHVGLQRLRPGHDAILFPAVMTLCGWGTITIWRIQGDYALRQAVWVCIGTAAMLVTLRWFHWLHAWRKYPYVSLLFGALLTALTVVMGVNPTGTGPRLWLGFGEISWLGAGVFLQPSELLKPLLAIFLAEYISRHRALIHGRLDGFSARLPVAFLAPIIVMWGLSILMVVIQRDLGAGWVLYWGLLGIFFLSTGRGRYVIFGFVLFIVGTAFAYFASDLVRLRFIGWLNPWSDPYGDYYQIVQSIHAIDAGGIVGYGIGNGTASQIPLAHSDFIFAAIVNEWGKLGACALLTLTLLVVQRIYRITFSQPAGSAIQILVLGVGVFLAVQATVNIAGIVRALPLTGVTLPFVSYGGSSVFVGFIGIGLVFGSSDSKQQ